MVRKKAVAAAAALILGPLSAAVHAVIVVEQIEAYADSPTDFQYTPVDFHGSSTITLNPGDQGGNFPNLTFKALTNANNYNGTFSAHANAVANSFYGAGSVAYPFVVNTANPSATSVYVDAYDTFLLSSVNPQNAPGVGPVPLNFSTGVKVVNNSYAVSFTPAAANTDALRRIDYLIDKNDLTFVAGAVSSDAGGSYLLDWSSFNCLAVSGSQTFNPAGGPGKQHADLFLNGLSSFNSAAVSGYSAALYGYAQNAGQSNASHGVVNRSLLMSGADKTYYARNTANNLSTSYGAGNANFSISLAALQSGEKSLLPVTAGAVTGTLASANPTQAGWAYGSVAAGGQSVVLFKSQSNITGLTASLNWNFTSPTTGGNINTSDGALIKPNLTLEVRSVVYNSSTGKYTLGSSISDTTLHSAATGDNVQFLYSTSALPTGTYAFVISGDPALTPAFGFSYAISGTYASQWNKSTGGSWSTASNWTAGMPDGRGAVANLLSAPGITTASTLTLDGDRTLGQLFLNNSNGYTISSGTAGSLNLDDTGDSSGNVNQQINVSSGAHTISAPISIVNTGNITVASGASLNLSVAVNDSYILFKYGSGALTFGSNVNAVATALVSGTTNLGTAGTITGGPIYINPTATLNLIAPVSGGILARNIGVQLNVQAGGILALSATSSSANRQVLLPSGGMTLAGTTGAWTGKLDLNNNDLIVPGGSLADVTNQVKQGYNAGKWNGSGGIVSTSAANNTTHLTALGVIQNNQGGSPLFGSSNLFDTYAPGSGDVLVKYTYYGDANLDGKVDGSDYSRIDNGNLLHLTGWFNGDFNYDGVVNGSDYTLIDNAYNTQGASLAALIASPSASFTTQISSPGVSVPEPALGGLIVSVLAGSLCHRRRKQR